MIEGLLISEKDQPEQLSAKNKKEILQLIFDKEIKKEEIVTGEIYINDVSFKLFTLSENVKSMEITNQNISFGENYIHISNFIFPGKIFIVTNSDDIDDLPPNLNAIYKMYNTTYLMQNITMLYSAVCESYNSANFRPRYVISSNKLEVVLHVHGHQRPIVFGMVYLQIN